MTHNQAVGWSHRRLGHLRFLSCLLGLLIGLGWSGLASSAESVPVPPWQAHATDLTSTLSPEDLAGLNQGLQALEQQHGTQLFVLMIPTTGPESIEQYARRVFDTWAIGRQNVDDGVLLLVARDDRNVRIEVGYGLEGAITDVLAGRIIREQMTPRFAQGDLSAGIRAGVQALAGVVANEDLPSAPSAESDQNDAAAWLFLLPAAFFVVVMPMVVGTLFFGAVCFLLTDSVLWGLFGICLAVLLALISRRVGLTQRLRAGSGRRGKGGSDSWGGPGGGLGGGGFGGGRGSGGSGGGGGRGGGGGASGSW